MSSEKYQSHLHVASIMNERTQMEKENFGVISAEEYFRDEQGCNTIFSEQKLEYLIDIYLFQIRMPYELISKTIERSRDRFLTEFNKFEADCEHKKFFTE